MCKPREKRETKLVIRSDTRFVPMLHHPEDVAGERRLASKSYVSLHYHFAGHLPLTSTLKQIPINALIGTWRLSRRTAILGTALGTSKRRKNGGR